MVKNSASWCDESSSPCFSSGFARDDRVAGTVDETEEGAADTETAGLTADVSVSTAMKWRNAITVPSPDHANLRVSRAGKPNIHCTTARTGCVAAVPAVV